eukprot:509198-Amphidinium_carterae.2
MLRIVLWGHTSTKVSASLVNQLVSQKGPADKAVDWFGSLGEPHWQVPSTGMSFACSSLRFKRCLVWRQLAH